MCIYYFYSMIVCVCVCIYIYIYIYIYICVCVCVMIIINKYILGFIYIWYHGCLSMTTGFMLSLYDNHQAEKEKILRNWKIQSKECLC